MKMGLWMRGFSLSLGLFLTPVCLWGVLLPLLASAVEKDEKAFPQLSQLVSTGAVVSALVWDLESAQPVVGWNAEASLTPASVTKAALALAVLDKFGPEHQFASSFQHTGRIDPQSGVLSGDLVFWASGDPGLTNEELWRLTTDLYRKGLRRVRGDLLLVNPSFGQIRLDENRAAGQSASAHAYDSPLSGVALNYSVIGVFVAPGMGLGQPAAVALEPYDLQNVRLVNRVKTVGPGQATQVRVSRVSEKGQDRLIASGSIAQDAQPRTLYRSVSDSSRYAGDVLRAFLETAGIPLEGQVKTEGSKISSLQLETLTPLVKVLGKSLGEQVKGLLRYSNNFTSDMLTIHLDARDSGKTLQGGSQALEAYVQQTLGGAVSGMRLQSGSGLTPSNKLSSQTMVQLLRAAYQDISLFPTFLAALPAAGKEGTLKDRFREAQTRWLQGKLRAKTGTLTQPVEAIGLAGYSRSRKGKWIAFSVLVNGTRKRPGFGVGRVRSAIENDLANILRAY